MSSPAPFYPLLPHLCISYGCASCFSSPLPAAMSLRLSVTSTNVCVPPLVLSYGSRPGPSPLTTFDPDDLTPGLKVTLFCYPFCLGLSTNKKNKKKHADSVGNVFAGQSYKSKMCYLHSLTLQGESVVECAEFLITTLLTFPLFGIEMFFKALHLKI